MTKEALLETAKKLQQPGAANAAEFAALSGRLAEEMNEIFLNRPDLALLIGQGNESMMQDNHRNHARFMESVFTAYNPEVLVNTVLWVFRAYRSHGFHLTYWPAQLDTWAMLLEKELSPDAFAEIYPFYCWMIIHQPDFVMLSDAMLDAGPMPGHE